MNSKFLHKHYAIASREQAMLIAQKSLTTGLAMATKILDVTSKKITCPGRMGSNVFPPYSGDSYVYIKCYTDKK